MQKSPLDNRYYWCYLAILCWLPIPFASKAIMAQDIFILLTTMLSACCCLAWLNAGIRLPNAFRRAGPVMLLFTLYLTWILVQVMPLPTGLVNLLSPQRGNVTDSTIAPAMISLSLEPAKSFHTWLLSMAYFQLFALTLLLINSKQRLRQLLFALVILGVLQSIYGGLMTLSGIEKTLWLDKDAHLGVATGTLLNRNHLANYLAFTSAAALGLLLSRHTSSSTTWRSRIRNLISWLLGSKGFIRISLVIMVIGLILTRSRMGNSAFYVSMTFAFFAWLIATGRLNRSTLLLFASLLVLDTFLMGSWFGLGKLAERIQATTPEAELRVVELPYLVTMARDYAVTGSGAGTFADAFMRYNPVTAHEWFNEAHCDYLQFLIENGAIGFTLLALVVVASIAMIFVALLRRHSHQLQAACFTALMGLIATGIQASVEYTLQRPATASLFVVFLALPWVCTFLEHESHQRSRHAGR